MSDQPACRHEGGLTVCPVSLNQSEVDILHPPYGGSWGNVNDSSRQGVLLVDAVWAALDLYFTPTIVGLGLAGNVVLALVLTLTSLKRNSANHYLCGAMMSDSVYLVGLALRWLSHLHIHLYSQKGWCQCLTFINKVSCFLSLWFIVAFSIDRLIVHVSPTRAARLCTPFRAKIVICAMIVMAVVVFVNISLTVGVVEEGEVRCVPLPQFDQQLRHLDLVDSLVNIVLPYTSLSISLVAIAKQAYHLRHELDDPHSHGVIDTNQKESTFQSRPPRLTHFSLLLLSLFLLLRLPHDLLRLVHSVWVALHNFQPLPRGAHRNWGRFSSLVFDVSFAVKPTLIIGLHGTFRKLYQHRLGVLAQKVCGSWHNESQHDKELPADNHCPQIQEV